MIELSPFFFFSAFFAGVLMFLAPCTLPLLPAYLGFISGVTEVEIRGPETRKRARMLVMKNSLMFVLGFSSVFMVTGLTAGLLGNVVFPIIGKVLSTIGGIIVIVFGLFLMGGFKSNFLNKERRLAVPKWVNIGTPISSALLGGAFAIGWTPCIGPVYGTILIYASTSETLLTGALLLGIFVIGFSIPFLLSAALISQASWAVEKALPYLHIVSMIGGVLLIILGTTLLIGHTELTNWFFHFFDYLDFEGVVQPYL